MCAMATLKEVVVRNVLSDPGMDEFDFSRLQGEIPMTVIKHLEQARHRKLCRYYGVWYTLCRGQCSDLNLCIDCTDVYSYQIFSPWPGNVVYYINLGQMEVGHGGDPSEEFVGCERFVMFAETSAAGAFQKSRTFACDLCNDVRLEVIADPNPFLTDENRCKKCESQK